MNIEEFIEIYCSQCYWGRYNNCDIEKVKLNGCCDCAVQDELDEE